MKSPKSLMLCLFVCGLIFKESASFSKCASSKRRAVVRTSTTRIFATPCSQQRRRRQVLQTAAASSGLFNLLSVSTAFPSFAATSSSSSSSLSELTSQLQQARKQLDAVPKLINDKKWDSVRAILIQPPLSDCWTKSSRPKPLLLEYAEAIGDSPNGGDELAALEAKEELLDHLRYLDMAVYNNVFNPIGTEGESGATKELIRSYYEDPMREYKASVAALEQLIQLGKESM